MKNSGISEERKKYLQNLKIKKISIMVTQILVLVVALTIWEILANLNIIDSFITSQPSRILETLLNFGSNDLMYHVGVTSYETIAGFLIRNNFRCNYSNNFMVVRVLKKSSRTIFSCFKQLA